MPIYLKQSTASQEVVLGYFVDSTDGNTEETALTIANTDIKIHKAGSTTLANKTSGGATHISNGLYYAVLDATDTDTVGSLVIYCHVSGALAVRVECVVLTANVYDSLIGGTDLLDANTAQWLGTACATPTVAGVPEVDLTHVGGATTDVSAMATNVAAILVDTGTTLDARIPAALVGGRMDVSVGAMAANVVTDAAIAADVTAVIADAVWNGATASYGTAGTYGALVETNLDAVVSTLATQASVNTIDDFLDTEIAAIKAKTDSLTFTKAGEVDANIQSINDVTIVGNGGVTPFNV